jgi:hypothetical protein
MRKSATVKKLRLSSETLHQLDQPALEQVAGGATNGTVCPYSACLTSCGCNTRNTCTTRYC